MRWRTLTGAALATLLALAGSLADAAPAAASTWNNVRIGRQIDDRVLDVASHATIDRSTVYMWSPTSSDYSNQLWNVDVITRYNDHNVVRIRGVQSGRCLDKSMDVPDANGNKVYIYGCAATLSGTPENQRWELVPSLSHLGWYQLRNMSDHRCLESGWLYTDGVYIDIWDCSDTNAQYWRWPGVTP